MDSGEIRGAVHAFLDDRQIACHLATAPDVPQMLALGADPAPGPARAGKAIDRWATPLFLMSSPVDVWPTTPKALSPVMTRVMTKVATVAPMSKRWCRSCLWRFLS